MKQAINRGLSKAIVDKQEVMSLILSNLAYAYTGEEETLDVFAIEQQIKALSREMDDTIALSNKSEGNPQRFGDMLNKLCAQMKTLREQLELAKSKVESNEKLNCEIERLRKILQEQSVGFYEYDDVTVRLLVEYIRVMPNNIICITLKGGMLIEENF